MGIQISWDFPEVTLEHIGDRPSVVRTVTYTISATDGIYYASYTGQVTLPLPISGFTPYEQITAAQVQSWIETRYPELVVACQVNLSGELTRLRENSKTTITPHFCYEQNGNMREI
jgi:hypothetical protein